MCRDSVSESWLPLGVRGVVEICEDPVLVRRREILDHPLRHGPRGRAVCLVALEHDEVRVAVVKAVIGLGPAGDAASLPSRGEHVPVVVRARLTRRVGGVPLMVPHGGPAHRVAKHLFVHAVKARGELSRRAVAVGHVPHVQIDVRGAPLHEAQHAVSYGRLSAAARARVPHDPGAELLGRPRDRTRGEEMALVRAREQPAVAVDRVVVGGVRREPGDERLVTRPVSRGDDVGERRG